MKRTGILNNVGGCNRRPTKYVRDVELNLSLINCRSLKFKLDSLAKNFEMNNSTLIMTTETWFKRADRQLKEMLIRMEDKNEIACVRKDRKTSPRGLAHGGVGLFFDKAKCDFKKLPLNALSGVDAREYEILAVRGRLKGVRREIVVFTCYLPPNINKDTIEAIMETLTDSIGEAKAKTENPWIVIGGDWNRYNTNAIPQMFPDLQLHLTTPTRGDAILDYVYTNFESFISHSEVAFPVESNSNPSDHGIVICEAKLERPASYAWETHEYLKLTDEGTAEFVDNIGKVNWEEIRTLSPNVDNMAREFHKTLDGLISKSFVWKRSRRKSSSGLRASIKRRLAVFRSEGRSKRWKAIDRGIKETIRIRKSAFFDRESERLKSMGRASQWYSILSRMTDDESPKAWNVMDLQPDADPKDLANKLAEHFTNITNETPALKGTDIPTSKVPNVLIPQVLTENIAKRLKNYKIPNSTVPGDIPKSLVQKSYLSLAVPLTYIYNTCLARTAWPKIWKNETVVPIPKVQTPLSFNDLRPISMSPLWSKLLETIVSELTLEETAKNWLPNQHGGVKGSSTDHVLVEAWDNIMRGLDKSSQNKAVVVTALDFSKSFSRCGHQQILQSYASVGASNWLIRMHAAFLVDRTMSVKIGITISPPRTVTGGAVQGSVLGVLDHNVVLNDLDKDLTDEGIYSAKYVDDLTLIEKVDCNVPTVIDSDSNRNLHSFNPELTQEAFDSICENSTAKGLKINESKTQLLSISSAHYDTEARILTESDVEISSTDRLKVLGFVFGPKPSVSYQIENLIRRTNKRFFVLVKYKKNGIPTEKLKDIYCSVMRSVLEYSGVVYHSLLTKYETNLLERVQKRALRAIYGYDHSYEELLVKSGLRSLEERRALALSKFAHKTAKNDKYNESWFPMRDHQRLTRFSSPYQEERAGGNRLYRSPLFTMRRHLNNNMDDSNVDLTGLFNSP